jgi:hypothetical protein
MAYRVVLKGVEHSVEHWLPCNVSDSEVLVNVNKSCKALVLTSEKSDNQGGPRRTETVCPRNSGSMQCYGSVFI